MGRDVLNRLQGEWECLKTAAAFEDMKPFLLDAKGSSRIADVAARLGGHRRVAEMGEMGGAQTPAALS